LSFWEAEQLRRGKFVDRASMMAFAANLKRDPNKRPNPFTFEDFMPGHGVDTREMDETKMRWKLGMMGLGSDKTKVVNF
jgi:hypothetical protein